MALPNLPDRKPMFDGSGFPTVPTRVWWQAVKRVLDGVGITPAATPFTRRTLTASGAALATDYLLLVDATAGAVTVTLPAAASSDGAVIVVKKIDTGSRHVTVDGSGAETIDGDPDVTIVHQYDSATVACDGAQWWLV